MAEAKSPPDWTKLGVGVRGVPGWGHHRVGDVFVDGGVLPFCKAAARTDIVAPLSPVAVAPWAAAVGCAEVTPAG